MGTERSLLVLRDIFTEDIYGIETASVVSEALYFGENAPPDIIVTATELSVGDCIETLKQLREIGCTAHVFIIDGAKLAGDPFYLDQRNKVDIWDEDVDISTMHSDIQLALH